MKYLEDLKKEILKKISEVINENTFDSIVNNDLAYHIKDDSSSSFQQFYFKSLDNYDFYFGSNDFFRQFKYNYSLQGIDILYLELLEKNKSEIYNLIKQSELSKLYFKYFAKAQIKQKNGIFTKNLGSFFVKLVHTFQPEKYCALDNPIKNYFGLKNESFFIAFNLISKSYIEWIKGNKYLIEKIRENLKEIDTGEIFLYGKLTDLKILDLIFWKKANV